MNVQTQQKQGFTIIEVVLVLAIAALIFLMVFIALPALQSNQRDTARKQDVSLIASAINTYRSNNKNALPGGTNFAAFKNQYLNELNTYEAANVSNASNNTFPGNNNSVNIRFGYKCDSSQASRSAAVRVKLENGNADYCVDA